MQHVFEIRVSCDMFVYRSDQLGLQQLWLRYNWWVGNAWLTVMNSSEAFLSLGTVQTHVPTPSHGSQHRSHDSLPYILVSLT